jgi:hypothetical protein
VQIEFVHTSAPVIAAITGVSPLQRPGTETSISGMQRGVRRQLGLNVESRDRGQTRFFAGGQFLCQIVGCFGA